jgi:hypothetical protein
LAFLNQYYEVTAIASDIDKDSWNIVAKRKEVKRYSVKRMVHLFGTIYKNPVLREQHAQQGRSLIGNKHCAQKQLNQKILIYIKTLNI